LKEQTLKKLGKIISARNDIMKRHMLRELNNSETEKIIAKQNYRDDLNNLRQYKSDLKKIALQVSASHSFHAFSGETT